MATFGPGGFFVAVVGSNTYLGNGGWVVIDYRSLAGPMVVDLIQGLATRPGSEQDTLVGITSVFGSLTGDTTVISANNQFGGVLFVPAGGSNTFIGNTTATINQDGLGYEFSPTGIYGDIGAGYVLNGWGGTDTIINSISGFEGTSNFNDVVFGDDKDTQFRPNAGSDYIDGRGGSFNLLIYDIPAIGRGLFADLTNGYVNNPFGGHDQVFNFHVLAGTAFSDVIIGPADGHSFIAAGAGNNIIMGQGSGNSVGYNSAQATAARGVFVDLNQGTAYNSGLTGGFFGSAIPGGSFDTLINIQGAGAPRFPSILIGSDDNNDFGFDYGASSVKSYVFASNGNDLFRGSDGIVTVIYSGQKSAYTISFDGGGNINLKKPGTTGSDYLVNVAKIQFSNGVYDTATKTFSASPFAGYISGTTGDDALVGTSGNDTFNPQTGKDLIYGSGGSDTVVLPGDSADYSVHVFGQFLTVEGPTVDHVLVSVFKLQFDDGLFTAFSGNTNDDMVDLDGLLGADGGGGVNRVVATGASNEYTISSDGVSATVEDGIADRDGTVNLRKIHWVQFTDKTIDVHHATNTVLDQRASTGDVSATAANESIYVGPNATGVSAGDGDDAIYVFGSAASHMTIDGGTGTNTAVFIGIAAQYSFSFDVVDQALKVLGPDGIASGPDGIIELKNIQTLQFSDQKVGVFLSASDAISDFNALAPDQDAPFAWAMLCDTAANIIANLNDLQTLATRIEEVTPGNFQERPFISGVHLTDNGIPTLSITAQQSFDDQRAINLIQTQFKLVVTGSSADETLVGQLGPFQLAGNTLNGGAGSDRLLGGFGNDSLEGGGDADTLIGGLGNDMLDGADGDDTIVIIGQEGLGDTIQGGTGSDTLQALGAITLAGFDAAAMSIEVWQGNGKALSGTTGNNAFDFSGLTSKAGLASVIAGAGNDTMIASDFGDIFTGGVGKDTMTGGSGADIFDFNSKSESLKGINRDVILNFEHGVDDIDLIGIDAKKGGGNQAFKFIGAKAFHHKAGELQVKYNALTEVATVSGDVDGNGKADFQIEVHSAAALAQLDFLL